jgi:arylsulfatase A-like enzyme
MSPVNRTKWVRGVALTLALSLCILAACQKNSSAEKSLIRLIDLLKQENILKSPLFSKPSTDLAETTYPINSMPMLDSAVGENPMGLKRKLNLGSVEFNMLFAPPKSEYNFDITIPKNGILDFGIGIVRDQNSESLPVPQLDRADSVEFIVVLEIDGRKKTIFQKHLKTPPLRETRTVNYSQNRVALSPPNRKARLTLITSGKEGIFSFWANPSLYDRIQKRTNVVLVSIDTLRADHLGVYGYGKSTTPAMDALAGESAVFLNTYASAPWTLPSHVAMLTSLNGIHHGVYYENDRMNPSLITLADFLRADGYFCAALTGAAFVSSFYGFSKGFDSYGMGQGEMTSQRLAEKTAQESLEWLDTNSDKPFFLFVHTYQAHAPYSAPEPYNTMFTEKTAKWKEFDIGKDLGGKYGFYKRLPEDERQNVVGLYDGEIRYTDDVLIKPLINKLRALNIYDRTLLIVTSDHGEGLYDHATWDHIHNLYDESLKVPLIIKFPGSKHAGRKLSPIVRLIDIMPTILEELGIAFNPNFRDGRSLIPVLQGREIGDRVFTADLAENVLGYRTPSRMAMNSGKDKVIINMPPRPEDREFFGSSAPSVPAVEIYDLEKDAREKNNLAEAPEKARVARRLLQSLYELVKAIKPNERTKAKLSKELEEQLKSFGYIR